MIDQHPTNAMRRIVNQLGFPGERLPRAGQTLYLMRPPLFPLMTVRKIGPRQYEIDYHSRIGQQEAP